MRVSSALTTFLLTLVHCQGLQFPLSTRRRSATPRFASTTATTTQASPLQPPTQHSTVLSSAALIAGTTIGGGFLALPRATAPAGAAPSAAALVACWAFLLHGAFALAESTLDVMGDTDTSSEATYAPVTVFSVAQRAFGPAGGAAVGALFFVLMLSTLVAQLSKGGTLLADLGLPRTLSVLGVSALFSAVSFGLHGPAVERVNTTLTATMLAAFGGIVAAARAAGWTAAGLARADPAYFFPVRASAVQGAPWSIPVFLQLLVYTEVVPVICGRLRDRTKVKQAIALGSTVPLAMCIVWTCVALGLVDPTHAASQQAVGGGDGLGFDPVRALLLRGAAGGGGISRLVLLLAGSAIATTLIGSFLALAQFYGDVLSTVWPAQSPSNQKAPASPSSSPSASASSFPAVARVLLTVVPPTVVSAFGSPALYYLATAFAGAFPVTALWGFFPSAARLVLRRRAGASTAGSTAQRYPGRAADVAVAALSVALLVTNVALGLS